MPKEDKTKFTGSGHCTNYLVFCDLQCERCIWNKPLEKKKVKVK